MDRRDFFKWLGVGVGAAPAVRAVADMPDAPVVETGLGPRQFADGQLNAPSHDFSTYLRRIAWSVVDGLLYDRIRFQPGQKLPNVIRLFQVPVGQLCTYTNVLKTFRHTNMYTAGQLSAPRQFFAQRVLFAVHPSANDADVSAVSELGVWEFQLMCKVFGRAPMLMHGPARAGLREVVAKFPKGDTEPEALAVNPLPAEVNATAHNSVLTGGTFIPSLAWFELRLSFEDQAVTLLPSSEGGRGLDLLIAFQGADARGVQ